MISISPLTTENFDTVINLHVHDDQARFVASNTLSIAQSKVCDYLVPRVIELNGTPIGFALYGRDPDSGRIYIVRLMIDRARQRCGYGAAAGKLLLAELSETYACSEVFVSLVPGNIGSGRLFQSLGFQATEEIDEDGEVVYSRKTIE